MPITFGSVNRSFSNQKPAFAYVSRVDICVVRRNARSAAAMNALVSVVRSRQVTRSPVAARNAGIATTVLPCAPPVKLYANWRTQTILSKRTTESRAINVQSPLADSGISLRNAACWERNIETASPIDANCGASGLGPPSAARYVDASTVLMRDATAESPWAITRSMLMPPQSSTPHDESVQVSAITVSVLSRNVSVRSRGVVALCELQPTTTARAMMTRALW